MEERDHNTREDMNTTDQKTMVKEIEQAYHKKREVIDNVHDNTDDNTVIIGMEMVKWAEMDMDMDINEQEDQTGKKLEANMEELRVNKEWYVKLSDEVHYSGMPNRFGVRRRVNNTWNLRLLKQLLKDYEDNEVCEWLEYGWPINRDIENIPTTVNMKNHKGANQYPELVN